VNYTAIIEFVLIWKVEKKTTFFVKDIAVEFIVLK
jgi:hypothetical protein